MIEDTSACLYGEFNPWPSKDQMAEILKSAGLNINVGRYSIRIKDCAHFAFKEYGGDLGDPVIEADAPTPQQMQQDAHKISNALKQADIPHTFEIYNYKDELIEQINHNWPTR